MACRPLLKELYAFRICRRSFRLNWKMALGCGLLLPLVAWPVKKFGRKIRRSAENSQTRLADLSQILQETVSGNRVVKAFAGGL